MDKDLIIPCLSSEVLENLNISTDEVVQCIESFIAASAKNTVWSAPKAVILPPDGRYMMAALAAADDPSLLVVKTVVLNPDNPKSGLPQINGLVTVLNSVTGLPVVIMDANWITAVRTAGLSAVAAKHMARKSSSIAAFIGCGVQAQSHLKAFSDMFALEEIRVFGRGKATIDSFCEYADSLNIDATVCSSGNEAMKDADIIVTSVTYSANLTPFLDANCLKPGSFCTVTDLSAPWIKDSFSAFDQICIDDLEQEAALPNKLVAPELVTGDISGLALGKFTGRKHDTDRTAFIFRGHALGDLALTALAWQKAEELD